MQNSVQSWLLVVIRSTFIVHWPTWSWTMVLGKEGLLMPMMLYQSQHFILMWFTYTGILRIHVHWLNIDKSTSFAEKAHLPYSGEDMSMVVQIEKPAQEMSPRSCTQSFSSHIVHRWHIVMSNYCENRKGCRWILCQNNQIAHPSCAHFDSAGFVWFQVQYNDWLGKKTKTPILCCVVTSRKLVAMDRKCFPSWASLKFNQFVKGRLPFTRGDTIRLDEILERPSTSRPDM